MRKMEERITGRRKGRRGGTEGDIEEVRVERGLSEIDTPV